MSSIRLSKEHGLNPTIPICFVCNKPKNEIALLGSCYHGKAPQYLCMDKVPCEQCLQYMEQGTILISVKDGESESSKDNPYRQAVGW